MSTGVILPNGQQNGENMSLKRKRVPVLNVRNIVRNDDDDDDDDGYDDGACLRLLNESIGDKTTKTYGSSIKQFKKWLQDATRKDHEPYKWIWGNGEGLQYEPVEGFNVTTYLGTKIPCIYGKRKIKLMHPERKPMRMLKESTVTLT